MRDFRAIRAAQAEERAAMLLKAEQDKQKADEMRRAAMEGMSSGLLLWMLLHSVSTVCFGHFHFCSILFVTREIVDEEEADELHPHRKRKAGKYKFLIISYHSISL